MAREQIQKGITPTPDESVKNVIAWILRGQSLDDITEALQETTAGTKTLPADILRAALEEIAARPQTRGDLQAWHIECRRELYRECMRISDFKAAHAILMDLGKLDQVYDKPAASEPKRADKKQNWGDDSEWAKEIKALN